MNGMGGNADEADFSDDDFDSLPNDALLELEQKAFRATQPPPPQPVAHPASQQRKQYVTPGPPQTTRKTQHIPNKYPSQKIHKQSYPAGQYGHADIGAHDEQDLQHDAVATPTQASESFLEEQMSDEVTLREQWRRDRFSKGVRQPPQRPDMQVQTMRGHQKPAEPAPSYTNQSYNGLDDTMLLDYQPQRTHPSARQPEEEALQAQIASLRRTNEELTTKLYTQQGEVSIVREKLKTETTMLDRQLAAQKKAAQDEASRHKTALDSLKEEIRKLSTHNQFLKHDLAQETGLNQNLQKTLKDRPVVEKEVTTISPSKAPAHSLRDGFDDGELLVLSPSKTGRRSNKGTPTAGNKRKRKVDVISPVPPLTLRQSSVVEPLKPDKPEEARGAERVVPVVRKDRTAQKNYQFVQRVFNHRVAGEPRHLVEHFVDFAFPADTGRTFTTIIIERAAQLPEARFLAETLGMFVDLWKRALKEKYHKCVSALLEVVEWIINSEPSVVDAETMLELLPLLQQSASINATIRFKHSPVSQASFGKFKQTPPSELNSEVDESACLDLIYNVASICLTNEKKLNLFWRSIEMDFILLMLNSSQPIPQITLILQLLATSVLPETFAMISDSAEDQAKMEYYILDRVCWLFWETPRVDEGQAVPTRAEICRLRLEAMSLLHSLAITSFRYPHTPKMHHGSLILAKHRNAIARLVRSLYDELAILYFDPPSPSPTESTTRPLHIGLVNSAVQLLHHLLTVHSDIIDIQQKLLAINGCVHRYRVVLTRLAFSEESVWHDGITEETVEKAFVLLEEVVTPEEAEMLVECFPQWKGRR